MKSVLRALMVVGVVAAGFMAVWAAILTVFSVVVLVATGFAVLWLISVLGE